MNTKYQIVFAFIDSQNLNLSIRNDVIKKGKAVYKGWKLDFKQFYIYLKDVHRVSRAYIFIGYKSGNEKLYTYLQECGFICIFKPSLEIKINGISKIKGNCDAEMVLHTMIQYQNFDQAIVVSGDGDFYCLIEYLKDNNKLNKLLIPNKHQYSSLLTKFSEYFEYVNNLKHKLEKQKNLT
jgi:uncharacterized LabA/DUF88 family protein